MSYLYKMIPSDARVENNLFEVIEDTKLHNIWSSTIR